MAAGLLWAGVCIAQESEAPAPPPLPQGQQSLPDKQNDKSSVQATTKIKIRVTTDTDKPLANASVYVRFYISGGFLRHEKLAEMNFKTNQDGSVKVPEIPQGKILIQVIAPGWHTYGKWYDVDQAEQSIVVKLSPPTHWY
ncbi:MAG TPA: carboxypeptidase-like regulatory domain-containing protein [Verrucomicrobiae bacterium]|nr:carboxypeptidase-like regulatory domain-containing protein [Verrucomicrobiae bacterium]